MSEITNNFFLFVSVLVKLYSLEYLLAEEKCPTCLGFYDQNSNPDVFGAPDIDTNSAIPVKAQPLEYNVDLNKLSFLMCNEGFTVTITPIGESTITLGGSLLCGQPFKFWRVYFTWSPNNRDSSVWTLNGVGYPLCVSFIYYNGKYSDPRAASDYPDGLVSVDIQVLVGGRITNPKFATFYEYSQQIICYNKCVQVDNGILGIDWLLSNTNTSVPYYSFTTKVYFLEFKKNITISALALSYASGSWISDDDFSRTFGLFQNENGETYSNNYKSTFDAKNNMKVYEATGLSNNPS